MNKWSGNFFIQLSNSIINVNFYKMAVRQAIAKGMIYLLLISTVFGFIASIKPAYEYSRGIDLLTGIFQEEIPDFVFKDGKLNINDEMPVITGNDSFTIIIDTTGETGREILDDYDTALLVLKDRIIHKNMTNIQENDFSYFSNLTITKDTIRGWLPYLKLISLMIVVFAVIAFVVVRYLSAFIASFIAFIISSINNIKLSYTSLFNLSAYSLTIPIILVALFKTGSIEIKFFWLIYFFISAIYLWAAIRGIKKDTTYHNLRQQPK